MELSESDKKQAKDNGFILVGKTGVGKTTILNAMFGKVVGVVKTSAISVTTKSDIYYYKLKNGKCITFVDTPGLCDTKVTKEEKIDLIHLNGISKILSDEKIHIKGILFLVNFQSERFDASEQDALLNYNKIFPLKNFWKHMTIIYTHYYVDPYGDFDEEEIKKLRNESNKIIFCNIMEKIKNVSNVIPYEELKKKYFNSFSEAKKEIQKKMNDKNRIELEELISELCEADPLFCQIEIKHIKNHKWEENGKKYFGEVEIIGFFDLNNEPIKERTNIISKEEVKENINLPPPSYSYHVYNAQYSSSGDLSYQHFNGDSSNSHYAKQKHPVGWGILGGIAGAGVGALAGIAFAPISIGAGIGLGIGALFGLF